MGPGAIAYGIGFPIPPELLATVERRDDGGDDDAAAGGRVW